MTYTPIPTTLEKLKNLPAPIRVGVVGAGEFGREVITQIAWIPNMEVAAVVDTNPRAGVEALLAAGYRMEEIECPAGVEDAREAMENGKRLVLRDAMLLCELPLDVLVDSTGSPVFGAEFAALGLENKKHVVVVNIESTVSVGAALTRLAREKGVVYTTADGDQPSLIAGLCDWARTLGMEVEVAGKWTGFSRKWQADPNGKRSDIGYHDGSKNQIEMCCVANITGLTPDVPGMHCPSVALEDTLRVFDSREAGGILHGMGVVEAINCLGEEDQRVVPDHLQGGVFVIASCENPEFCHAAKTKGLIASPDGRRVLLYRPYHFVGIETPVSILRAVLYGEATGAPLPTPVADVYAIAKRDLAPGEILNGVGGDMVRGEMECITPESVKSRLPLALAEGIRLKEAIAAGTPLTLDMVKIPEDSTIWKLYQSQFA
ncbi:MAG: hypothetical protein IKM13_09060 [Clostridia bacterium]|nr:hypothetical protein [Clostridia bacterium]